jgi:tRNA(Ile)-lysidine synthase
MRAAGPFPGNAAVAVAVSGGADSMTLVALVRDWAAATRASLTALTVDHGLRPESRAEAAQVAAWCREQGIAHEVLLWRGEKPEKGIQAAARAARYALLEDWCGTWNHTALLVAHTLNDQAETFLMRMSRGSGVDGLAAMPLVSFRDRLRLIRPLLTVPRSRIEATATSRSLKTVSDPSNLDRRYARVRMRAKLELLEAHGVSAAAIAGAARIFGKMRAVRERAIAALAEDILVLHRQGYAEIACAGLCRADLEIAGGLVAMVLMSVGGLDYAPRRGRFDRLLADMLHNGDFRPRTLGNCVVSIRGGNFLVRREHRTIRHRVPVTPGLRIVWDGRFTVEFARDPAIGLAGYSLEPLGEDGWRHVVSASDRAALEEYRAIPGPVRFTLPSIRQGEKVVNVPHLRYRSDKIADEIVRIADFRAPQLLAGHTFSVA